MQSIVIRPLEKKDNAAVARLIRTVMPEFGASGPGFAIQDAEVDDMYSSYSQPRSAYFVITRDDQVWGGGGIAPLSGGDPDTCELRKMYFLPGLRGLGLGQKLMDLCLKTAREQSFSRCYLETMQSMSQARALYIRNDFLPLKEALGNTGHFSCNSWYLKKL